MRGISGRCIHFMLLVLSFPYMYKQKQKQAFGDVLLECRCPPAVARCCACALISGHCFVEAVSTGWLILLSSFAFCHPWQCHRACLQFLGPAQGYEKGFFSPAAVAAHLFPSQTWFRWAACVRHDRVSAWLSSTVCAHELLGWLAEECPL